MQAGARRLYQNGASGTPRTERAEAPSGRKARKEGEAGMTLSFHTPDVNRPWLTGISFRDFEVSWAGAGPESSDLCFASEEGRYFILKNADNAGLRASMPIQSGSGCGDVINGMAFHSPYVA